MQARTWPEDGGEMGALIRSLDWSETSLGPVDHWPQSLRTTVDTLLRSPVPMVLLWGPDGLMIYNDAYSVFAGGRHPRLLGSKVLEGWPGVADFNRHVMSEGLAGRSLTFTDQELVLHRAGGPEKVAMNLGYSPVMGDDGRPAGVLAVVVETTRRVKAEREARETDQLFRRLVQGVTDYAIFMLDADGRVASWNPGAERIKGYRPEEIIGQHFSRFYTEEDRAAGLPQRALAHATGGSPYEAEGWRVRKDGTRFWASVALNAIRDAQGRLLGFAKVTRDITERKASEQALAEAREALFQAQKMDALGRLHHDRENPCGTPVIAHDRAVAETHGHFLRPAGAVEHQLLVRELKGAAGQALGHDMAVEIRDLGPTFQHLGAQQPRMPPAGKGGIGVVVDHDPVRSPEEDHRHGRAQEDVDGCSQALRPAIDRAEARL